MAKPPVRKQAAPADAAAPQTSDARLRRYLGYRLKRAYLPVQQDARATVEAFGLRLTTTSALHIVVENPDLSQSALALALGIERSRAVLLVDELQKQGLVRRNPVPQDRRSYALRATPEGLAMLDRVTAALVAHEERLLGALTDAERKELSRLLTKVQLSASSARD